MTYYVIDINYVLTFTLSSMYPKLYTYSYNIVYICSYQLVLRSQTTFFFSIRTGQI